MSDESNPNQPAHPALASLSEESRSLFDRIAVLPSIRVTECELATLDGPPTEPAIVELSKADLLVRWFWKDQATVTLSPLASEVLDIRPNIHGTKWVQRKTREPKVRIKRRKLEDGTQVINETDLSIDPPGQLDQQSDPEACDPCEAAIEADEHILEAERGGGYTRPLFLVGGGMPWPVAQQDRGPLAPDPGPVPVGHSGLARDAPGPCGGCGGIIRKQEACLACDAYYADALLPKAARNAAKSAGDRYSKGTRAEVAREMKDVKRMREGAK